MHMGVYNHLITKYLSTVHSTLPKRVAITADDLGMCQGDVHPAYTPFLGYGTPLRLPVI